jgi:hypothetical protein
MRKEEPSEALCVGRYASADFADLALPAEAGYAKAGEMEVPWASPVGLH